MNETRQRNSERSADKSKVYGIGAKPRYYKLCVDLTNAQGKKHI